MDNLFQQPQLADIEEEDDDLNGVEEKIKVPLHTIIKTTDINESVSQETTESQNRSQRHEIFKIGQR